MKVRKIEEKDFEQIMEIVEKLKTLDGKRGWFQEKARNKMIPFDLQVQKGFVAEEEKILGFVTYTSYDYQPIIGWIGVDPGYHRKGTGKMLIEAVENEIKRMGGIELYVETPTKEEGIGTDYERTYKFYESVGFKLDKIKKKEEGGTSCDMAVLKKVLQ